MNEACFDPFNYWGMKQVVHSRETIFQSHSKISLLKNELYMYHAKLLQKRFHLNGHTTEDFIHRFKTNFHLHCNFPLCYSKPFPLSEPLKQARGLWSLLLILFKQTCELHVH